VRRADVDLTAVVDVERVPVGPDAPRVAQHGVDVERRRVVVEERAAVVARRAVRVQVVRGAEDCVAGVVDIASEPVRSPRRRHELHRPLRACGAVVSELVEGALDEVDRGEHVPPDAETTLALAVIAK
jgi:hypothetical protein